MVGVLGAIHLKSTFVLNDSLSQAGTFGVDAGARARHEIGGTIRMGLKRELTENVTYTGRLDVFSNYLEEPEAIDVFTDHLLTLKVNDWLATLGLTMIYDKDVELTLKEPDPDVPNDMGEKGPGIQLKQILAVGFVPEIFLDMKAFVFPGQGAGIPRHGERPS